MESLNPKIFANNLAGIPVAIAARAILGGEGHFSVAQGPFLSRRLLDVLTPREFEVMQVIITGMLNKQIAGELGIAEKTVKVHRSRVMQKLGVVSVAELVRFTQTAFVAATEGHKTKV